MKTYARIKELRKQQGLSAEEVARAIGVSRATIYRYETKDIENMPITVLEPLARVLNCSPGYLMGWEDEAAYYSTVLKKYKQLKSSNKQVVLNLIDAQS